MSVRFYSLVCALILAICIKYTQSAGILEEPRTQYALIGKNATFTCKTSGREAYWALNNIPMSITYQDVKQGYENKGVVFMEDITQEHYNLTMIIHASLDLNNTVIFCSVIGSDWTATMSQEVHLIVFNTMRPYSPAVTINISYKEHPTIVATISETPLWPGYGIVEFKMNITNSEDNTLLGRYNASAGNGTVEIYGPLPDSVIDQCVMLKISASAVSEQYGEGEVTETYTELFKTPGLFTDQGVRHLILPHTNDSLFHVSLTVKLPDVCKNQLMNYSFVIENDDSSEIVKKSGPYSHHGPGNVSHCIDGLDKNSSYFVVVQVESIAGNQDSKQTYLNTSNIKSCSAEDTTDLKTSTAVESSDYQYSTVEQIIAEQTDGPLSGQEIALVVILVVLLVTLVGVSGVFIWFCNYHRQTLQKKAQSYERSMTVKKVMVHNPIYSEPLYDKVEGPQLQIAIPPVPLSASDTQSINSSPLIGTPTPLLSTHRGHRYHGQRFIYELEEKMCNLGVPPPQESDELYTMMSPAPGSPRSPKQKA